MLVGSMSRGLIVVEQPGDGRPACHRTVLVPADVLGIGPQQLMYVMAARTRLQEGVRAQLVEQRLGGAKVHAGKTCRGRRTEAGARIHRQ